jgi:thiamine biosynthesis lipoprotein
MGSPCELIADTRSRARAETLARITAAEAWRIEDKFSRYRGDNIVDRINNASGLPVIVDEETARLIDFSATLFYSSDGLFDITSGVLRRAWTFDGSDRVPDRETVAAVLANVGWQRVEWKAPVLCLPAGMQIDFGGVGKEYAVDRAVAVLRERSDVPCLVNFGGDLAVTGSPHRLGAWQVGLESLRGSAAPAAGLIRLSAGALATSGDRHRYVQREGIRYPHILDPRTGWPVRDAPASITVAADTCVQAGVFSTLAMLQGAGAEAFLEREGVRHWCTRR